MNVWIIVFNKQYVNCCVQIFLEFSKNINHNKAFFSFENRISVRKTLSKFVRQAIIWVLSELSLIKRENFGET